MQDFLQHKEDTNKYMNNPDTGKTCVTVLHKTTITLCLNNKQADETETGRNREREREMPEKKDATSTLHDKRNKDIRSVEHCNLKMVLSHPG